MQYLWLPATINLSGLAIRTPNSLKALVAIQSYQIWSVADSSFPAPSNAVDCSNQFRN